MRHAIFAIAALAAAGCVTDAPTGPDSEPPTITVQVQNAVGGAKTFRSTDPASDATCVKVRGFPVDLVLSVADPGGVRLASLRVFPGAIDRASVTVPTAPDISFTVTAARGGENLNLSLTPPAPGRVRTGVVATLKANGSGADPEFAIIADATDQAGNRAFVGQVDIHAADSPVICN
ncbi:MAG: hypothetical protein U5J99_00785 [Parvularculaceae bacterium]|nr:hypothetical protein [Parvularculaceae bacterium]